MNLFGIFAIFLISNSLAVGSKILILIPHGARSHYKAFEPLFEELAERGHSLTLLSQHGPEIPIKNFSFIQLHHRSGSDDVKGNIEKFNNEFEGIRLLFRFSIIHSKYEEILVKNKNEISRCLNENYDLIIMEAFVSRFFNFILKKVNTPFMYISSTALFSSISQNIKNPMNPSYIIDPHSSVPANMNFFERIYHSLSKAIELFFMNYIIDSASESAAKKYFNISSGYLKEVEKNVSLILLNSHFSMFQAKPLLPHIIEVGGMSVKPKKLLPPNIEKFMNESTHGVIYFCMGSLLRGDSLPEEKRNAFLYAFSKVPQRVLWKWEGDVLPGKSDNIMISKWFPQRDILAHPNTKLFISHGGLLGSSEAVYEGVPIIGIPIFGDQRTNIRSIEASGAGEVLDYNEITKEVVLEKLQRLINDPKYKEKAMELSRKYKDRPMSALDTAVYWTEYVIRHNGAHHLKSAAVNLSWYQYLLLDVIAFLILVLVSALVFIYYSFKITFKLIYSLCCNTKQNSCVTSKKKLK